VSHDRNILGDNPDAFYFSSNVDVTLSYVVTGKVTYEDYFSLTIYTAPCEGCFFKNTIADVNNHGGLTISPTDGSYKVLVSSDSSPPAEWDGDFMSMATVLDDVDQYPPGTALQIVTRHYYERKTSIASDPMMEGTVDLFISLANRKDGSEAPSLRKTHWTDDVVSKRMRAVKMFVKKHSTELEQDPTTAPTWFSFILNQFGDPATFRDVNTGGVGSLDIAYTAAPFKLQEDEALVIKGIMPSCKFANVVLWNRYLQTFDYVTHQTSLNRAKMVSLENLEKRSGKYQVILSHVRPSEELLTKYDWLDTMGRTGGTVFWRFLLPEGDVVRPTAKVIKFRDI
jgi:hypothetical protein